jgi:hypothetical protein
MTLKVLAEGRKQIQSPLQLQLKGGERWWRTSWLSLGLEGVAGSQKIEWPKITLCRIDSFGSDFCSSSQAKYYISNHQRETIFANPGAMERPSQYVSVQ